MLKYPKELAVRIVPACAVSSVSTNQGTGRSRRSTTTGLQRLMLHEWFHLGCRVEELELALTGALSRPCLPIALLDPPELRTRHGALIFVVAITITCRIAHMNIMATINVVIVIVTVAGPVDTPR